MTQSISLLGLLLAIALGLVHIFASRTQFIARIPQRWWISAAGGVSIAYIFLAVFPELGSAQEEVEKSAGHILVYVENHVYILALVGLAIFYGLEKLALCSRVHNDQMQGQDCTQPGVFWLHIMSFAIYNAILGYLLRESAEHGLMACLLLFVVLALHFLVNDVGLRAHHKQTYDRLGRWILAGAIITGWAFGEAFHVDAAAIASIWSLVAGGVILNVLKEELPEEQDNHFGMFVAGATIYSVLLLIA